MDEEAKKKARAEMRKKLMLPDTVTSKLKGIDKGKALEKKKPEEPKPLFGMKEKLAALKNEGGAISKNADPKPA
jgi:hypothetical protein